MTINHRLLSTEHWSLSTDYWSFIPPGPFIYGPEECYERLAQHPPFKPRQVIELPGFWMAKYPITYWQWREFLEATGYNWGGQWYKVVKGWRGTFQRAYAPTPIYPDNHDNFPIVDVTQADVYAFCEWLRELSGKEITLPTEYEWEKAARGENGRIYPWGDTPPRPDIQWQKKFPVGPETWLFSLLVKPRREWARAGWYWRNGCPLPVGSIPQNISPYGCVDMSGNIWEWTSSLYNPALPDFHVVKGGSWGYTIHHSKLNVRSACSISTPSHHYHAQGTGFRVMYRN